MTDERPDDELEPKADDEAMPADDAQDELDAMDDENAELDEDEGLDDEPHSSAPAEPVASRAMRETREPRGAQETRHKGSESPHVATSDDDELPYIDDRASKIWVASIVGIFVLILAYGLLFGKSGALTPPTPSPSPTPTAAATTPAPSPSITAVPSITISPAPEITPTPTPAPSVTPAPSS